MLTTLATGWLKIKSPSVSEGSCWLIEAGEKVALGLGKRGEEREQDPGQTGGVVDARQRAGEHLQDRAVRDKVASEADELRGVAAGALTSR
ncbi:hypothetical protein ACN28G_00530 [Micromonospora sp. WMMA1923]|uniref:hypothetical protein n=1 Tax=Micromonospora sp. WMMA1923 TaxID=3404125 RepID=UPI003B927CD3